MNMFIKLYSSLIILMLIACGPTGDTEGLKQKIEKNQLNIASITIRPKYTQTIDPVTTAPANPKYYFDHNDTEQLEAIGITGSNDEIVLNSVVWSITDNTATAGATTINQAGLLSTETLGATQTKDIAINITFATLKATADVVLSSYPLTTNGLSIKIDNSVVNNTTQSVIVCDTSTLKAEGLFDDGSTRDVTSKITWSTAITDSNAKFVTTDKNTAIFSSHTNATYAVTPDYKGQGTATVNLLVTQTGFSNMQIDSSTVSIVTGDTHTLSVTADIDRGSGNVNTNVSQRAKWTSADTKLFTVDDSGIITGVASGGPASLTAQCGSDTVTSAITVDIDNTIESIEILDENDNSVTKKTMVVGDTVNLTLRVNKFDGSTQIVTTDENTTWEADTITGETPITIDNADDKGLVTAVAAGVAGVIAKYKGREDVLIVTVISN